MRSKGFVIEIALIGIIFTVGSVMFILMPLLFTKIHLVEAVEYSYNYNNAQLALLSTISVTARDSLDGKTKTTGEILGEYVSMPSSSRPDISFVKGTLDKMMNSGIMKCYKLTSAAAGDLASNIPSDCKPEENTGKITIAVPRNGNTLTDILTLVMS